MQRFTSGTLRRRVVLSACLSALASVLLPTAALAHGKLARSNPAAGARLTAAPTALRLTFTEATELAVTRVQLLGAGGRAVAVGPVVAGGDAGRTVVAAVRAPLAPGAYTVVWQMAGRDGHPVRGRFSFVVARAAEGRASGAQSPAGVSATPAAGHTDAHGAHRPPAPAQRPNR